MSAHLFVYRLLYSLFPLPSLWLYLHYIRFFCSSVCASTSFVHLVDAILRCYLPPSIVLVSCFWVPRLVYFILLTFVVSLLLFCFIIGLFFSSVFVLGFLGFLANAFPLLSLRASSPGCETHVLGRCAEPSCSFV